jgi:biotin carboxyl carrier protein
MSEDLARDLMLLAELFKGGGWREIRVETGNVSVLLSTDASAEAMSVATQTSVRPEPVDGRIASVPPGTRASTNPDRAREQTKEGGVTNPGWHAITAPNLGTFYRSPKPGSPPFVELGQRVSAETEICLIEVMKLFTSVKAGVAGTIRRIDATDADLVEGGQTLFHIEPE